MIRQILLVLGCGVVSVVPASWATLPAAETVQLERKNGVYMLPSASMMQSSYRSSSIAVRLRW
jgi:hypothetical protein